LKAAPHRVTFAASAGSEEPGDAAQLLRLYPRHWRKRYGDEFLALLETTAITRSVVRDVVRTAAREWYERTFAVRVLLAPVVTTAALWTAARLTKLIETPATTIVVNGDNLVGSVRNFVCEALLIFCGCGGRSFFAGRRSRHSVRHLTPAPG
jgi:hypothetical protein